MCSPQPKPLIIPVNMPLDDGHQTASPDITTNDNKKPDSKLPEIVFMTTVAGASILFGFGMTLALAKKRDPVYFAKGFLPSHTTVKTSKASSESELLESGSRLAVRALGWGTFYALSGFSLFSLAVWKLMAVQNLQEFRMKVGSVLPQIPKGNEGRTEFESLTDLMGYLAEQGKTSKQEPSKEPKDTSKA